MNRLLAVWRRHVAGPVALWLAGALLPVGAGGQAMPEIITGPAPSGVAQGRPGVSIVSHSAYWANLFGIGLVDGDAGNGPGLFVIRGEIRNDTKQVLRHVKLAFELLDDGGRVVVTEVGYNRSSEMLREIDSPIPWRVDDPPQLPIPEHGSDSFRMLFLRNETPPFASYRVRVVDIGR